MRWNHLKNRREKFYQLPVRTDQFRLPLQHYGASRNFTERPDSIRLPYHLVPSRRDPDLRLDFSGQRPSKVSCAPGTSAITVIDSTSYTVLGREKSLGGRSLALDAPTDGSRPDLLVCSNIVLK